MACYEYSKPLTSICTCVIQVGATCVTRAGAGNRGFGSAYLQSPHVMYTHFNLFLIITGLTTSLPYAVVLLDISPHFGSALWYFGKRLQCQI